MPGVLVAIESHECLSNGGALNCQYETTITQDITFTLTGSLGFIQNHTILAAPASGFFLFSGLSDDVYTLTCNGSVTGAGNSASTSLNCSGPPPSGCEVAIMSVTVTPGDGESPATATVDAYGSGPLEYSLNSGAYQSSNVFSVTPGVYILSIRVASSTDCSATTSFVVTAPDALSVTTPPRDWLPVGLPIYYTFQSPDAEPGILEIDIEVSANGTDFNGSYLAASLALPPDSNGQYKVNIAPYLEATFTPAPPLLAGSDLNLFRLYRLKAGLLTTPSAHALYATVLTPIISGIITLSKPPYGFSSSNFPGIRTEADTVTGTVENIGMPYSGSPDLCPKYPLHLYWLNRAGGWQTWVFDGKHEYGQETGDAVLWQDEHGYDHTASIAGVKESVNVYSGFIPLSAYDTVFGILSAIRVYHRDNGRFREVNIERGSKLRHKEGQRRKTLDFSFTYAETLTVQNA